MPSVLKRRCVGRACRSESGRHAGTEPDRPEPAWVGEVLLYWFEEAGEAHWFDRAAARSTNRSANGFWLCTSSWPQGEIPS